MSAAAGLASVMVAVDIVMCIKSLNDSISHYSGLIATNRAAIILDFLGPAALAVAVIFTAWIRLTAHVEEAHPQE